jgi:very-short-patch-repair endonuclease
MILTKLSNETLARRLAQKDKLLNQATLIIQNNKLITLGRRCQSPIEQIFWAAGYVELSKLGEFIPQVKAGAYCLNFALVGDKFKVAIECDSYEYHCTEVQINADNSRDLDLMCQGWIVIRFTSDRIWWDTQGCVEDVTRLVRAKVEFRET